MIKKILYLQKFTGREKSNFFFSTKVKEKESKWMRGGLLMTSNDIFTVRLVTRPCTSLG